MIKKKYLNIVNLTCFLALSSSGFATTIHSSFYVAGNAGVFLGDFNHDYWDQTDVIAQNISESVQQQGYTEGLAVGYSKLFQEQYLLSAELSGNLDSHQATFQAGASTASFSDNTQIQNHIDLTFVPGILLSNSIEAYVKLGLSVARLQDNLTSPTGYTPTIDNFNCTKHAIGFASGLGLAKYITDNFSIFAEGNFHDYGTVNFSDFQNFTANYTHSAHVYSFGAVLGATYHL